MKQETLEIIIDQLDSMHMAFDTLMDNCYHIELALKKELKQSQKRDKTIK